MNKPEMILDKDLDLSKLKAVCQEHLNWIKNYDGSEEDIYGEAMRTFFGENVFDYIDSNIK